MLNRPRQFLFQLSLTVIPTTLKYKQSRKTHHFGTSSWSSQVRVDSSSTLPASHEIRRGWPLTQVMRRPQSPGTAKRGKGRNLAEIEWAGTWSGQLNPTISEIGFTDKGVSIICSVLVKACDVWRFGISLCRRLLSRVFYLGSEGRVQGVHEIGWEKYYNLISTNLT
jgi:hypothetical protein